MQNYKQKYLKYKLKYLNLKQKKFVGGMENKIDSKKIVSTDDEYIIEQIKDLSSFKKTLKDTFKEYKDLSEKLSNNYYDYYDKPNPLDNLVKDKDEFRGLRYPDFFSKYKKFTKEVADFLEQMDILDTYIYTETLDKAEKASEEMIETLDKAEEASEEMTETSDKAVDFKRLNKFLEDKNYVNKVIDIIIQIDKIVKESFEKVNSYFSNIKVEHKENLLEIKKNINNIKSKISKVFKIENLGQYCNPDTKKNLKDNECCGFEDNRITVGKKHISTYTWNDKKMYEQQTYCAYE